MTGCPLECIPATVCDGLEAARHWEKSAFPVSGGWLEQSAWCLEAVGITREADAHYKAEAEARR